MSSVFSKNIGSAFVLLLGCIVCPQAGAQGLPDQPIEFLETLEIADTLADEEEREISIPKPDTTTLVPFDDAMFANLMVATISRNSIVSPDRPTLMRDSIADRKGLWQSVRLMTARAERRISLAALDTTTIVPFNGLMVATISKTAIVPQDGPKPELARDSIADRKALRKTVRLIKSERPRYPQAARREGWEGTVVLRITIGAGGDVGNVTTQTSSGFPALDESAMQSIKTWRFDPAKDGEFPVAAAVDVPIRFSLDEYGIKFSRDEPEPEPEPEPVLEQKPARLIKSERPDYPQTARQQGSEGTVVLRITVGTGGDVEKSQFKKARDFPSLTRAPHSRSKRGNSTRRKLETIPFPPRSTCPSDSTLRNMKTNKRQQSPNRTPKEILL